MSSHRGMISLCAGTQLSSRSRLCVWEGLGRDGEGRREGGVTMGGGGTIGSGGVGRGVWESEGVSSEVE